MSTKLNNRQGDHPQVQSSRVIDEEFEQIWTRAKPTKDGTPKTGADLKSEMQARKDKRENLVGLAFSGGGIRSATFNLGVLEGLKNLVSVSSGDPKEARQFGLLDKIDYLSTVSGGGYIGGWLSANCKRNENRPDVEVPAVAGAAQRPLSDWIEPSTDWSDSVKYLRLYSNYLAPKVGFFSADTWSMLMIWIRNTLLVQVTLILAIAAALIAPRLMMAHMFLGWPDNGARQWTAIAFFTFGVAGIAWNQLQFNYGILKTKQWWAWLILGGLALAAVVASMERLSLLNSGKVDFASTGGIVILLAILLVLCGFFLLPAVAKFINAQRVNYGQGWVQIAVVAPMMLVGLLVASEIWSAVQPATPLSAYTTFGSLFLQAAAYWPFPVMVVFSSLLLLAFSGTRKSISGVVTAVLAGFASMLVLHALMCAIVLLFEYWTRNVPGGAWSAFVWGPPAVLFAFSLAIVTLIGIVGKESTEGTREWWSRMGAWLGIYGLAWMVVCVATVYGPYLVFQLFGENWKYSLGGGWIASTIAGLFTGSSGSTGGKEQGKTTVTQVKEVVAKIAPFVFIAGLLIAVAALVHEIFVLAGKGSLDGVSYWYQLGALAGNSASAEFHHDNILLCWELMGACVALLGVFAWRVDINEFSLNAFYRNRLVRCYLGATRKRRDPQNFTEFDDNDDFPLADLAQDEKHNPGPLFGPLHLVNCALNLGGSSDLSLHTRHSASFTLTPFYSGTAYPDRDWERDPAHPTATPEPTASQSGRLTEIGYVPTNKYCGTKDQPTLGEAIAVSGAAASPNMGYHTSTPVAFLLTVFNARLGRWFPKPSVPSNTGSPWFSLTYLFLELFGLAGDNANFVAVSDGGHFENLAAYELIRRKCKVIIIGDAECDEDLHFEGLGTLIRMCKVDFNATIDIDVASILKGDNGWSQSRCAVGTIKYDETKGPDGPKEGILIYLKASMTGHEDTAILQYKSGHPTFPHETTGNQFYGEDQFESYRLLGQDVAMRAFKPAESVLVANLDKADCVATVAGTLKDVWSPTLRQAPEFVQNASRLMDMWADIEKRDDLKFLDRQIHGKWPEQQAENFRSAFYLGSQMLQLMENVYLDLRLEDTWDHPDNEGWKELFSVWSKADAVRTTWESTGETYGLRFRYFCERRLGLPLPVATAKRAAASAGA